MPTTRAILRAALSTTLVGCTAAAAVPPCPPPSEPPAPISRTDYEECSGSAKRPGASAVVRFSVATSDSVRRPERTITGPHTALCAPSAVAGGPKGELYVLNHAPWYSDAAPRTRRWMSWITVYDAAARGDATPVRTLHVHPRDLKKPISLGVDRAGYLYVGYGEDRRTDSGTVTVFDAGAGGDVAPVRVLHGFGNGLRRPGALAVDRRGYLYVANNQDNTVDDAVLVFAPGAEGDAAACRVISGPSTELHRPISLALDRKDRLYVGNSERSPRLGENALQVYGPLAHGDAAPIVTISGGNRYDDGSRPIGLVLDSRDSLYVRSSRALAVYAPGTTGALEPSRYIFMREEDLPPPSGARIVMEEAKPPAKLPQMETGGIFVDFNEVFAPATSRDRNWDLEPVPEVFALDRSDRLYAAYGNTVLVYGAGFTGEQTPIRRIAGPRTGLRAVTAIAVDRKGWVYVAIRDSSLIRVYPPGAMGNVAPWRTIGGPKTRLKHPSRLAIDRDGRLYVANGWTPAGGAIAVYAPGAEGEDKPVRVLAGPSTRLGDPTDMAFDGAGNLYVPSGQSDASISVFGPQASGDAAPFRTITQQRETMTRPLAVALGSGDSLYVLKVSHYYNKCVPHATADTINVLVYPPGAEGDAKPARTVSPMRDCTSPGRHYALGAMQRLTVDPSGAVRVWHPGGALSFLPGARGPTGAGHTADENPVSGSEPTGIAITRDGWVYRTYVPKVWGQR